MKRTYINQLPKRKNGTVKNAKIENGQLIVEVEFEEKFEPKDGDFLISNLGNIFIYSDKRPYNGLVYSCYCGTTSIVNNISLGFSDRWTEKEGCRYATEQEKADFLSLLETKFHKRWNAEKKCLEDIR